ncbi:Acyltransferase [Frankia sp. AiPs1]
MRALSVIAVLLYHLDLLGGGYVGVDVFFVLSGFLITGLLLAEWNTRGRISLRAFYVRRAFRLLPAFYVYALLGVAFVLVVGAEGGLGEYSGGLASSVFAVNNVHRVVDLDGGGVWFGQTWSLSVEDQFYFLWPALFILLVGASRRRPRVGVLPVLAGAVVVVALWRIALVLIGVGGPRIYLGLDTRADSLLVGAAMAVWFAGARAHPTSASAVRWKRLGILGLPAGAALIVFAFLGPEPGPAEPTWMAWGGYTLIALLSGVVATSVVSQRGPRLWLRLLDNRAMVRLGRISYAFYLWHFPVCDIAKQHVDSRFGPVAMVVFALAATYSLAWLSALLVERPAARRRPRWADVGARFPGLAPEPIEVVPPRAAAAADTFPLSPSPLSLSALPSSPRNVT